ncbi:hypothetical protein [Streptomyces sp. NPDC055749]
MAASRPYRSTGKISMRFRDRFDGIRGRVNPPVGRLGKRSLLANHLPPALAVGRRPTCAATCVHSEPPRVALEEHSVSLIVMVAASLPH